MPNDMSVRLMGEENEDGTFNAWAEVDGKRLVETEMWIVHGACDDVRRIHSQLEQVYPGSQILIAGPIAKALA